MLKGIASLFTATVSTVALAGGMTVPHTSQPISIDGVGDEAVWAASDWAPMDKHILGELPAPSDFSGHYKLAWDAQHLYLLVEITDDVLYDAHPDPLKAYWDDDCLEIFLDEDASGGEHQFNYNAFAYHLALDNQAVDIGKPLANGEPNFVLLNDHVQSTWQKQSGAPHAAVWEVAVDIYNDEFDDADPIGTHNPVTLTAGKTMGFMLAYCDNDGSREREHFMGSHEIKPINGDKNLGYKTADVFGRIRLAKD